MKINNFLTLFLVFLLVLTPIASSNEENNATQNNLTVGDTAVEINENVTALGEEDLGASPEEEYEIGSQEKENELDEVQQVSKIQSLNLEKYLPTSNPKGKYEAKKLGNRKYEYIRIEDGKKFNSISEIRNEMKTDETVKLRDGFEERLNLSAEKVRILVSLKIDPLEVQKEIQNVKEKYKDEEDKFKEEIREISIKYAPETKRQAIEITETKDIIKISDEDLDRIKDKGRELEQVKEQEVREIKNKLSAKTEKVQNEFSDWIRNNGGEIKRELNGLVSVEVPIDLLEEVLDRTEVGYVEVDENLIKPLLDVSTPTVSVSNWWAAGYNGFWTDTAVLDTGVDETHPALETDAEGVSRTFISQDFTSSGTTDDTNGHGTHVAGIIASSDSTYEGVAPGVDAVINAKHLGGVTSDTLAALDWAITNPIDGAEILSNSWGCGNNIWTCSDYQTYCFSNADGETSYSTKFIDAAVDYYDIISVNAAGNEGLCGTYSLTPPADSYNAIVVGAIDDRGTTSRTDDSWLNEPGWFASSVGPTYDERKKPDIVAPGLYIKSTNNGWEGLGSNFVEKSGTSMAAPHVSGAANLLLEYGLS